MQGIELKRINKTQEKNPQTNQPTKQTNKQRLNKLPKRNKFNLAFLGGAVQSQVRLSCKFRMDLVKLWSLLCSCQCL